MRIAHIKKPPI